MSSGDEPVEHLQPQRVPHVFGRSDLLNLVRGLLMGSADIIPGVSGGTVALILGIYQRLITAISRFDLTFLRYLRGFEFFAAARHVDLRFLVFLGAGILTGVVGLASTMHWLLENHLERTLAAFFGMILASSFLVGRMVERWNTVMIGSLVVGGAFAYWLVGLPFLENPPDSLLYLFLCGAIAICAMILPGISGAFILLILGKYYHVTGVLRSFVSLDVTADGITTVVVFAAGAVTGLLSFSRLLRFLLERYHSIDDGGPRRIHARVAAQDLAVQDRSDADDRIVPVEAVREPLPRARHR